MGIKIDDLQPLGASLLSGNESLMDNLRELSPEELKISGRGKKGGFIFIGGGGAPAAQPVVQQPIIQQVPVPIQSIAQPVPVATGNFGGLGGFGGFGPGFSQQIVSIGGVPISGGFNSGFKHSGFF